MDPAIWFRAQYYLIRQRPHINFKFMPALFTAADNRFNLNDNIGVFRRRVFADITKITFQPFRLHIPQYANSQINTCNFDGIDLLCIGEGGF